MGSKVKSDFFDVHVLAHTLSSQDALYGIAAELGEGLVELQKHPIPYVAKCIETNAHTKEANSGTLYALYRPAFSPEHSLRGQLLRHEYLTTDVVCFYAAQLLLLLKDLHKRNLCCRLLDKDHIFIDDEGLVCVMDPTLSLSASVFFEPRVHAVTASEYSLVPPECRTYMNARDKGVALPTGAEAETINKSADFWRLGCLIFELAVGLPPFRPQLTEIQAAALRQRRQSLGMPQLLAQSQGCLNFPRSLPSSLRDFLSIALMADSVARLKNVCNQRSPIF